MITVECGHGATAGDRRPEVVRRRDRMVAAFASRHTITPDVRREPTNPPEHGRWELDRQGAEGTAIRSRRGTWTLRCPRCERNLQVPERELFRLFDVRHWGPSNPTPGTQLTRRGTTWDTTLDLAAMLRARG